MTKNPEDFLESLCTPLERDPRFVLMQLQNTECESDEIMPFQRAVLTVDLYLQIERRRKKEQEDERERQRKLKEESEEAEKAQEEEERKSEDMEEKTQKVLDSARAEWENIHHKVIFDAMNEAFDSYRPYGLKGPPLPWSRQVRALTFRYGEEEQIFELFEQGPGTLDFPPAQILGFSMASPVR